MTTWRLDPTVTTVADVFSCDRAPVLTVAPGDTVVVRSLDASGNLHRPASPGDRPARLLPDALGHCLTGPIAVVGAEPGSFLRLDLRSMVPDDWGWTVAGAVDNPLNRSLGIATGAPSWLLWDLDVGGGTATEVRGLRCALRPFLGVLGVAPAAPGDHSTIPPRSDTGGNIDCRELVAGSTVFLPVQVPGALLSLGDGHAAQGDGEVGGTAVECAMTTELVVDVAQDRPVPGVHAVTPTASITFGFDPDLNAATAAALDAMLTWVQARFDVDRTTALAFASVAVDLRVTQVANRTWGVHAVLAHDALERADT